MGAWGYKLWENDEAANWFSLFMKKVDTSFILDEAEECLNYSDDYDKIRAIAYILATLGKIYIWPIKDIGRLEKVKEKI